MSLFSGMWGGSTLTSPKKSITNIQRGYDQSSKSVKEGSQNLQNYTGKANAALSEGKSQALDYITGGTNDAQKYYDQASKLYGGLASGDMSARAMYLNALGLNGASGNQAAQSAFQVSPGYQFNVDQANQNILRNAAATGGVASGNALEALQQRGMDLANQEWGGWLDRLSGLNNNLYQDYSGQAAALNNLGSMYNQAGINRSNIATGTAGQLSGNYTGLGGGLNTNNLALAKMQNDRAANINNAQQAAAQNAQAQSQAWANALGGLAGNIFSAAGNAGGFGSLFG